MAGKLDSVHLGYTPRKIADVADICKHNGLIIEPDHKLSSRVLAFWHVHNPADPYGTGMLLAFTPGARGGRLRASYKASTWTKYRDITQWQMINRLKSMGAVGKVTVTS